MNLKIAFGSVSHVSHSFCPRPTDIGDFRSSGLYYGADLGHFRGTNSVAGGVWSVIERRPDITLLPLVHATAPAGGIVVREAFDSIPDEIESRLRLERVDAVVLDLGGTLISEDHLGGDGEIVRRARSIIGPHVPIIVVLGGMANLDPVLLAHADIVLPLSSHPSNAHTSIGQKAMHLAIQCVAGEVRPIMRAIRLLDCPPVPAYLQGTSALAELESSIRRFEATPGVLSAGVLWGFPYADVPHYGVSVVATADGDEEGVENVCEELGELILECLDRIEPTAMTVEEAVHTAMEETSAPIILADCGDDPGSGAAGDGTALLWALLDLGAEGAAIGTLCDPAVVDVAFRAGVGGSIEVELGSKLDEWNGAPIPVTASVLNLTDGQFIRGGPPNAGQLVSLGRTAVMSCRGRHGNQVEVIVCERRLPVTDIAVFRSQGIEPTARKIVVVKSGRASQDSFSEISSRIIFVDTPGLSQLDLSAFPFAHVAQPVWPHDASGPRMIRLY